MGAQANVASELGSDDLSFVLEESIGYIFIDRKKSVLGVNTGYTLFYHK
jgi:hypothetical protein